MKPFIIPIVALAITGALFFHTTANTKAFDSTGFKASFVQSLADKLGVAPDNVETAYEDMRAEHRATAQARFETRLDELVTLGKLTAEQQTALLAKHAELQQDWDAEQSRRQARRIELQAWAEDQGIDLSLIGSMGVRGEMGGHGMHGMHGDW